MGEKLIVGPISKGLKSNLKPFAIDNDSFPVLQNAYQWRGRVKRKRGTQFLTRLRRTMPELSLGVTGASPWSFNIFSTIVPAILPGNGSIVPGSVIVHIATGTPIDLVDNGDGTLSGASEEGEIQGIANSNPAVVVSLLHGLITGDIITITDVEGMEEINGGPYTITVFDANVFTLDGVDSTGFQGAIPGTGVWYMPDLGNFGTINYSTGAVVITTTAPAGTAATICVSYYPALPVMGFRDFAINSSQYPGNLAFDTRYSYNVLVAFPYTASDVSYYKNPSANGTTLPGYVPKTDGLGNALNTALHWNGEDYQQFYTINYQGALWATNGITVPFDPTKISMQFKPIVTVDNITGGPPAIARLHITAHGLVKGDFVYVNEVLTTTGINFQTGYVVSNDPQNANFVDVEFPFATIATNGTGGIAQYLTNNSDPTKDCIRWYDGAPISASLFCPDFVLGKGWVNFMPPLSRDIFSIADLPARQYYLVGAKVIAKFKDRLVFFGPVVQASSGLPIYLQDTAIFSQNGTPYYTSSFTYVPATGTDPTLASTVFHSILVPENQTATAPAWFEDQTGFGGFVSAGLDEPIFTVGSNEDALIVGFDSTETRFMYTGNDIIPFLFYVINSELGSGSTFSTIEMDQGVITRGDRGITITSQTQSQRIDLDIPDENFEIKLFNNGAERLCAQRDFINEWCYFTYPVNNISYNFPTQTLLYNYRDNSWAIFRESYTTYGQFNPITGFIWATVGNYHKTWKAWDEAWNAGQNTQLQPQIVGGNQQGFLIRKDVGTDEGTSLYITSFSGDTITSPDHCLNSGDFIMITGVLGSVGSQVNNKIFKVYNTTATTFQINPTITSGTYLGGGYIIRLYKPFIQTKQFPAAWADGRKTRIGQQQYLLDSTEDSQITLLIYLSQDSDSSYNSGPIVPQPFPENSGLVFSTVLFTCPESTNLGLTPYTKNLQMPTAIQQNQIWHRINTSLIGDTVQLGFTISDDQMKALVDSVIVFAITGASTTNPCVLTCAGEFGEDTLIRIDGVLGMTQLNGNVYNVLSSNSTQVTIEVNASGFTPYISGGTATEVSYPNPTAEVVLHGFILDLNPSYMLS